MRKLLLLLGALFVSAAGPAGAIDLKEGQHYTVYKPARATESRDRIEITEFFWYGCGHCFNLEPLLQKWLKTLPKDVSFRRVPAIFRDGRWAPGARLYYTLEAMGLEAKLHQEVFDAIHVDRVNLSDDKVLLDWMARKGVDTKKFADTYHSFSIQGKVSRAQQLTESHGLDGVPTLIVDGRYKPASGAAASFEDIFVVVDGLIDMARKDRAKK